MTGTVALVDDAAYQPLTSARNKQVYVSAHLHERRRALARGVVDELHRVLRKPAVTQSLTHDERQRAVGAYGLLAASEDTDITGFYAERRGVYRDVRRASYIIATTPRGTRICR